MDLGIIIGVSSEKQLEENMRDLEKGPLPEQVVKVLDEAWLVCKPTTGKKRGAKEFSETVRPS
jgi:hypothetical protein